MTSQSAFAAQGPNHAAAGTRARFGWVMLEWANQPFFSLITTFIFAPYFTATVIGDPIRGQALWGYGQSVAGLIIALSSPFLGAIADAAGPRKKWLAVFQSALVTTCFLLWWATPHAAPDTILLTLALIVAGTVAAEVSGVFSNAMLPGLIDRERMGRLSGIGWGMGYLGGLVALVIMLVGFSLPHETWFHLDHATHQPDRVAGPLVALWVACFSLPLFLFTPDARRTGRSPFEAAKSGIVSVVRTLGRLTGFRQIALFLLARMIAYDGLNAIFAFGGIYAVGMFGWNTASLGIFGIVIIVFAALGAIAGGWFDDRIGSKITMQLSVLGVLIATLGVLSMTRQSVFFFLPIQGPDPAHPGALFATAAERIFLGFGVMIGIFGGPMQAAARTYLARLAPAPMMTEFFGLYALSGRATAYLAPFAIALLTQEMHSQRAGLMAILAFLGLGFVLMIPLREAETTKRPPR